MMLMMTASREPSGIRPTPAGTPRTPLRQWGPNFNGTRVLTLTGRRKVACRNLEPEFECQRLLNLLLARKLHRPATAGAHLPKFRLYSDRASQTK